MNSPYSTNKRSLGVRVRRALQLLGCVLGVLLLSLPAFSQGSTGRILGTVVDQSGGTISGATVTVLDKDRGVSRTLITDDAGAYNAPNLTPGNYTVRAESKGFKVFERQNIVVEVAKELRIDATLQPGDQNQTITITESIPLVETTNATLGGTLDNADIADLPLNGRDYQNLMGLRPGVMLQPGGGPWTQSTNGVRPDESVWMVEGVINMNFFDARPVINMPSPFTDGGTILPIDAIQEFNLEENPKAEYGWKAGAVVNVGIKSGTNQLHGAAYAFGRSDSFDARNYYNIATTSSGCAIGPPVSACDKLPVQLKQFGGVAGGPIKKDKLFFFGGFEGLRSFLGSDFIISTPQTSAMVAAINSLQTAGVPRSGISLTLLGCQDATASTSAVCGLPPTATTGLYPIHDGSNNYLSAFPVTNRTDNGVGKIDYHMNDKNTISGSFFYGKYAATGEDHGFANQAFTDTAPLSSLTTVVSWVYTPNSNLVNEMRFGYDRASFNFINVDLGVFSNGTTGYALNTGVTDPKAGGFPNIAIAGPGYAQLGTSNNRPQTYSPNPYFDFQDSVSVLKGKHAFKFGGEFAHIEADAAIHVHSRGQFNFSGNAAFPGSNGLADFFAGTPSAGQLLTGDPTIRTTWMSTAGYLQDDWRATPKLIVNLGLRYEYITPMKEASDNFGSFDPTLGMVQQGHGIDSVWKGDHRAFGPRLGFAYDVNGKGTTVIRGGSSIIHSSWVLTTFMGQFGLYNDVSTSLAAVPTGAALICNNIGAVKFNCPATAGGTDILASETINSANLCWDPKVPAPGSSCTGSLTQPAFNNTPQCGNGFNGAPSPCDIMGTDPNLRSPLVWNYNLSVTHTFGSNLSLEVGYVGNRGYRLLNFADINQAPLGAAYCMNSLTAAQKADACANPAAPGPLATQEARPFYSKFPYLGFINYATSHAHSRYDSMQVSLTKRMSHGLSFNAGYTFGHGLDSASLNRFGTLPQDSTNPGAEYASSDFDIRHRVTLTATYQIPGIKGFGQLLEGWEINSIVNYQTAQPWEVADGIVPGPPGDNFSGTGENTDRWNIFGNPADFPSGKVSIPSCTGFNGTLSTITNTPVQSGGNVGCNITTIYGNVPLSTADTTKAIAGCTAHAASGATLGVGGCIPSANLNSFLTPPVLGSFGNMGRNIFRDSGLVNVDLSIFKNFRFKERYGVQFRFEAFNIMNHPTGANPYGASSFVNGGNDLTGGGPLGFAGFTPDWAAGNPVIGSGSQRVMQLGLKLTF
jgi:hypothetical protein